ncbi:hypothetical protein GGP41_006598 [Bipolaris sorokiniana]|uniref:Uncharacterized protein n=1 Tax=Cochliobolus sativus TaxID=45130 RepID=A0A8H5ZRL3_COCSA|nr:hypothetical protein GGP41_006598 [Bipolaris sorokiniana]
MLEANFPEDQTTQRHAVNVIVLAVLGETQLSSAMLTIPSFLGVMSHTKFCLVYTAKMGLPTPGHVNKAEFERTQAICTNGAKPDSSSVNY